MSRSLHTDGTAAWVQVGITALVGFASGLDYAESAESIQFEHNSTEKGGYGTVRGTAECHSNLSVHTEMHVPKDT